MNSAGEERATEFVNALLGIAKRGDRAGLAALRRSLGRPVADPAEAAATFYRILPPQVPHWAEPDYWLAAGLFGLHPLHREGADEGAGRSLGISLRDLAAREPGVQAGLERRFVALLDADREELDVLLRSLVQILRAHEQRLDYVQLIGDLRRWSSPWRTVQRQWARGFWRRARTEGGESSEQVTETEATT